MRRTSRRGPHWNVHTRRGIVLDIPWKSPVQDDSRSTISTRTRRNASEAAMLACLPACLLVRWINGSSLSWEIEAGKSQVLVTPLYLLGERSSCRSDKMPWATRPTWRHRKMIPCRSRSSRRGRTGEAVTDSKEVPGPGLESTLDMCILLYAQISLCNIFSYPIIMTQDRSASGLAPSSCNCSHEH